MKQRVVVTGLGVVSPLGFDLNAFWDRLVSGQSGISKIESFDAGRLTTQIAGEVKGFDPEAFVSKKEARKMDRFTQFAVAAADMAMKDAKLSKEETASDRVGTLVGTYFGGVKTWEEQLDVIFEKGPKRISPFFIPMVIVNMAAGMVSIHTGAKGMNSAPITGCASGANAVGDAFRLIQRGEADVMFAGAGEAALTEPIVAGFQSLGMLSDENGTPERASRPFAADRKGMVMGEGGGIVVLESLEHALKRGATIYAEVVGYGMTSDAYDLVKPEPTGHMPARTMEKALKDAGLTTEDVGLVLAYGIGTPESDQREAAALHKVFGDKVGQVPVHSSKASMGHLFGASGAVDVAISALALKNGVVPPTVNAETAAAGEFPLNMPSEFRKADLGAVLVNTFGIGGHNASLVLKQYKS